MQNNQFLTDLQYELDKAPRQYNLKDSAKYFDPAKRVSFDIDVFEFDKQLADIEKHLKLFNKLKEHEDSIFTKFSPTRFKENIGNKVKDVLGFMPDEKMTNKRDIKRAAKRGFKRGIGKLAGLGLMTAGALLSATPLTGAGGMMLARGKKHYNKNLDLYKKKINDIEKIKQDFAAHKWDADNKTKWDDLDNQLAGGSGGWLKAKRKTNVLVGEGPTHQERYAINNGSKIISGVAHGPTKMSIAAGSSIWAGGSGGKSTIDNDLSSLAGGTELEASSINPIVHAIKIQTDILRAIFGEDKDFHADSISRMDDLANANKGFSKSPESAKPMGGLFEKIDKKETLLGKLYDSAVNGGIGGFTGAVAGGLLRTALPALISIFPELLAAGAVAGAVYLLWKGFKDKEESDKSIPSEANPGTRTEIPQSMIEDRKNDVARVTA